MDSYMTFDVHVSELSKKVVETLMHINRISLNFEQRTRALVVQSLLLSIVNYCIRIWSTTNATLLNIVQKFCSQSSGGWSQKIQPRFLRHNGTKMAKNQAETCI